ncbi:restriction endonuclease subunit S [Actinomadura barringtoniae]|uniref:Restriction endonuclease subunit S n=1 Tax=Actinomadura barringtoniae TaxID=1427535 RepID=A0A939PKW3_9ACTN|nr:restriction endonuclease subunit S [Actinomadura barringtoniae]MBO2454205.1 restriction endonuclease subunit S [Actinomadura barringtoniae]
MTELPSGWTRATLGDIAVWGSGGTPKTGDPRYYGGSIPWATIGDLTDGVVGSTTSLITEEGLANSSARVIPAGTVLIAMYGASIGRLGINSVPLATNQAIAHARVFTSVMDHKFLFWYLHSQREDLVKAGKGAAQPNISQTILRSWPIVIPPKNEQIRIVETLEESLSRIERGIGQIANLIERIDRFRDALMAASCTGKFSARSNSDLGPAGPSPANSVDGDLPNIPNHWNWTRLGEIAEVVGGVTKDSKKQSDPTLPEVPYLRVANVQRGRLDLTNVSSIRVPSKKAKQLELQVGDVLLNEGGDRDKLGRGWIWEGQISGCIHQNHVFRARILDGILHPKLLAWHANGFGKRWCEINGKQSVNLASISLSKIKMLPVPLPPFEEQERLVTEAEQYLTLLDGTYQAARTSLARAYKLRKSLLAEAFAGRLSEQGPMDEPASAMLERNRAERAAQGPTRRTRSRGKEAPQKETLL